VSFSEFEVHEEEEEETLQLHEWLNGRDVECFKEEVFNLLSENCFEVDWFYFSHLEVCAHCCPDEVNRVFIFLHIPSSVLVQTPLHQFHPLFNFTKMDQQFPQAEIRLVALFMLLHDIFKYGSAFLHLIIRDNIEVHFFIFEKQETDYLTWLY
jgi:hypothetical protein